MPAPARADLAVHVAELGLGGALHHAARSDSGAGEAGAPKLDTEGRSHEVLPRRAALYRPVRLTERQYRHRVAAQLEHAAAQLHRGPEQSSLRRRAHALAGCGEQVVALACGGCGAVDSHSGRILVSCSLRVCPACARLRADELRGKMDELVRLVPKHRDFGFYLFTFTTRFDPSDPADLTADAIRDRAKRLRKACSHVWRRVLKTDGAAMLLSLEVSPSGAVHAHALYFGPRQDITVVRAAYLDKIPDSPFVNVKHVKKPKTAVREVAKYIVKAASPKKCGTAAGLPGEYLHPELAAKVEVALRGMRLFDFFGAWRGVTVEPQQQEAAEAPAERCVGCGQEHPRWRTVVMPRDQWLLIAAHDWTPRLSRSGIDPPLPTEASSPPLEHEAATETAALPISHRWRQRFRRWQAAAADAEQRARFAAGITGEKAA
jgi:hypothetical protein